MPGPNPTDAPSGDCLRGGERLAGAPAAGAPTGRLARLAGLARIRRRLVAEAAWELVRARVHTMRPASRYTRHLGRRDGVAAPASPEDEALAAEIGAVVEAVAAIAPFRARCLQQALAVRRMLARRGITAVVHIGMARDPGGLGAHAWVTAGRRIVTGDTDLERYVLIGSFS